MQLKQFYMITRLDKTYVKGMTRSGLFNQKFGSNLGLLLLRTENEEEAKTFFKKIKVEDKKLKIGEQFNFYYFYKITYNENEIISSIETIDFKHDDIK